MDAGDTGYCVDPEILRGCFRIVGKTKGTFENPYSESENARWARWFINLSGWHRTVVNTGSFLVKGVLLSSGLRQFIRLCSVAETVAGDSDVSADRTMCAAGGGKK